MDSSSEKNHSKKFVKVSEWLKNKGYSRLIFYTDFSKGYCY